MPPSHSVRRATRRSAPGDIGRRRRRPGRRRQTGRATAGREPAAPAPSPLGAPADAPAVGRPVAVAAARLGRSVGTDRRPAIGQRRRRDRVQLGRARSRGRPSGRAGRGRAGGRRRRRRPGTTTPSRAWRPAMSVVVDARMERRDPVDLGPDVLQAGEPRSTPRRAASSVAIIQSGQATPGAVTSWPSQVIRPFEVGEGAPPLGVGRRRAGSRRPGGSSRSGRCRRRPRSGPRRGPCSGQVGVGEVGQRVGAEQDQAADAAPAGGVEDPGGVEPGARRAAGRPSGARTRPGPSSRPTRPGSTPGARPMSRAPCTLARRRADRKATPGRPARIGPPSATGSSGSASDGRPRTTTTGGRAGGRRLSQARAMWARTASIVVRGHPGDVGRSTGPWPAMAAARAATSPGRYSTRLGGVAATGPSAPGSARRLGALLARRVAQAQVQDRQLVFDVGRRAVMTSGAAAAWSMVARGSPSTSSAGSPSPSWASTLSVPRPTRASLAQA